MNDWLDDDATAFGIGALLAGAALGTALGFGPAGALLVGLLALSMINRPDFLDGRPEAGRPALDFCARPPVGAALTRELAACWRAQQRPPDRTQRARGGARPPPLSAEQLRRRDHRPGGLVVPALMAPPGPDSA